MFFLVEYDRAIGEIGSFQSFSESQRLEAEEARLALELRLRRAGVDREIVLLEADNVAALRKTHQRYFENSTTLVNSISKAL